MYKHKLSKHQKSCTDYCHIQLLLPYIWYTTITSYNFSMHVRKGKLLKAGCTALIFIISYGNVLVISPENFSSTVSLY